MGVINSKNQKIINENWGTLKCSPIGPILQSLGVAPGNMNDTSAQCKSSEFSAMFDSKIKGQMNITNILGNNVKSMSNQMQSMRAVIKNIQQQSFKNLQNVATKLFIIYVKIGNLAMSFLRVFKDVLKVYKYLIHNLIGILRILIAFMNLIRRGLNKLFKLFRI